MIHQLNLDVDQDSTNLDINCTTDALFSLSEPIIIVIVNNGKLECLGDGDGNTKNNNTTSTSNNLINNKDRNDIETLSNY